MIVGLVLVVVLLLVLVRWRQGHARRRRSEAMARQATQRPLSEFDARFPADRLLARRGKYRL